MTYAAPCKTPILWERCAHNTGKTVFIGKKSYLQEKTPIRKSLYLAAIIGNSLYWYQNPYRQGNPLNRIRPEARLYRLYHPYLQYCLLGNFCLSHRYTKKLPIDVTHSNYWQHCFYLLNYFILANPHRYHSCRQGVLDSPCRKDSIYRQDLLASNY